MTLGSGCGLTCRSELSTSNNRPNVGDTAATAIVQGPRWLPAELKQRRRIAPVFRGCVCTRDEETRAVAKGKRTFQPNNRRRARVHGFRLRMRTRAGRAIVSGRRRKGRRDLTA